MNNTPETPTPIKAAKHRNVVTDFFIRLVKEKPLGTLGGVIILIFVLVSVFADVLAPYHYDEQDVVIRLQGSSAEHLLGTDHVGRDFLSRNIYGARISLLVGVAATSVDVIVGDPDRCPFRIHWGAIGPDGPTLCRRLDGLSGTAPLVDYHVHCGPGVVTDHRGPGGHRRHRQL